MYAVCLGLLNAFFSAELIIWHQILRRVWWIGSSVEPVVLYVNISAFPWRVSSKPRKRTHPLKKHPKSSKVCPVCFRLDSIQSHAHQYEVQSQTAGSLYRLQYAWHLGRTSCLVTRRSMIRFSNSKPTQHADQLLIVWRWKWIRNSTAENAVSLAEFLFSVSNSFSLLSNTILFLRDHSFYFTGHISSQLVYSQGPCT